MLVYLGVVTVSERDLVNIAVIQENGTFLIRAIVRHGSENLPYVLYVAKDFNDAARYLDGLSEKNNYTMTRYLNEKVNPPQIQLWPNKPEDTAGVPDSSQDTGGNVGSSEQDGSTSRGYVENLRPDVMDDRDKKTG
jgi:hypothetical protein